MRFCGLAFGLSGVLVSACSGADKVPEPILSVDSGMVPISAEDASQPVADSGAPKPATDAGSISDAGSDATVNGADAASSDAGSASPDTGTADAALPAFEGEGTVWTAPAPRATCGSGDKTDPGTQGIGGDLRCNVEIVGQVDAPHFLSMAWYKQCAYVNGNDGTTVIDVSDPTKPTITTTLTTAGMRSNWETMKAHQGRGVLVGYESVGPIMDVYDLSADCTKPVLKASFSAGGIGHAGNFSTDGTIYYASSLFTSQVFAVDIAQLDKPKLITSDFVGTDGMPIHTHDLSFSKNGTRGYFTFTRSQAGGSIAIVDTTSVQKRDADAKGVAVSELGWEDGSTTQFTVPVTIRGQDHLIVSDELGSTNCDDPKKPQYGYARILNISDEKKPTVLSKVLTEALDPSHCQESIGLQGAIGFGVGTHYCNVDRTEDPRILACGFWEAGLRLFDIRNPWRPREIGYFDTPNGSVPGLAYFPPGKKEIWVTTGNEGSAFYVLKFRAGSEGDQILSGP